jgi:hypothetical protein
VLYGKGKGIGLGTGRLGLWAVVFLGFYKKAFPIFYHGATYLGSKIKKTPTRRTETCRAAAAGEERSRRRPKPMQVWARVLVGVASN